MARSLKNIQDAIERKKQEVAQLEAAEAAAKLADEKRTNARRRDFQALILGHALLDLTGDDVDKVKSRVWASLSKEDQDRFEAGPVDPVKPTKAKTEGAEKLAAGEDAGQAKAA